MRIESMDKTHKKKTITNMIDENDPLTKLSQGRADKTVYAKINMSHAHRLLMEMGFETSPQKLMEYTRKYMQKWNKVPEVGSMVSFFTPKDQIKNENNKQNN